MTDPLPRFSTDLCERLREAFAAARYDADGVVELLGTAAHAALGRDEPEPAYQAAADAGALGTLIRLFLLGSAESGTAVSRALAPATVDQALDAGLLRPDGEQLRAALDIRPHADEHGSWWVVSDIDTVRDSPAGREYVGGVGHAAMSLVRATSRSPVGSLCDIGTGSGVQALHASRHARSITATDVSPRALALAEGTFLLNQVDVELLRGAWFSPVARRRFDRIVCNPPFVVGPARVDYTYRDSGLAGDEASALVVRQLPSFLAEGGTGHVLGAWLHTAEHDWEERVRGWLPPGTDAWFVQRDVADPPLYVGTWIRDAGIDPASPEGRRIARDWLDWFASAGVEGIGFGFVTLRRIDEADRPTVVCEDLRHAYDDPLGAEAQDWLRRVDWLRTQPDLCAATYTVPPTVVLEQINTQGESGWEPRIRRLHRTDGPGWQHELDELASALLAGCQGHLPLADLLDLLAAAHGEPTDALVETALPIVRELVLHGMLLPAELARTDGVAS
ncbi:Methyltransferase small domain-containing protein [Haloechinothrix alba]|uniref:Methyltransferase small domain-containing protein n=1 Tax=Haloechinothrix alba TaxID=664784 RepID=A0A238X6K5_9PSEU|nr:class I SAM-dependent methyltransferase [Haloechinothrix alba]SNR54173.1 Methyltransferase small domain-containing protein [Haloechinothrix alba]